MIILGEPEDFDAYYMCEIEEAFELQKKGFHPRYLSEDGMYYFKHNSKLGKYLKAKSQ